MRRSSFFSSSGCIHHQPTVNTTSASATAATASSVRVREAPDRAPFTRASASTSGVICSSGGAAMTMLLPRRVMVSATEVPMASAHLPTKAHVSPSTVPRCSRIVKASVIDCTGWS